MDLKQLAQKGQEIYERKYKQVMEEKHHGEYIAIDVISEASYLGKTPEEAAQAAQKATKGGFVHLIRIGYPGVYRMGTFKSNADYSFF